MTGKLTIEDGKSALRDHAIAKGCEINEQYGPLIDYQVLLKILEDRDSVKFPIQIKFDSSEIDSGMFAVCKINEDASERSYTLYIHEFFQDKLGYVPMLAMYHLITVNYGDFATHEDAEFFGASALGLEKEEYYEKLCELADMIPGQE